MCVLVAQSSPTLCDPMDSSFHGIFRQEYWSGLPFPSPGDLPNPGVKPGSPALQEDSSLSGPPRIRQYSSIAGVYYQYQQHHCWFYTCFWAYWAWNKDSALLCSIQYCTVKYTEAQPLVDDTNMWQCIQTRELTYVTRHANIHSHLSKFKTWRFVCRGLTVQ